MNLKELGQKQKFPNWYKGETIITDPPCGMHTEFRLKAIPRLFPEDEVQIKFQNFLLECDSNRVMVAYFDLIDDLKSGKISINDWNSYTDPSRFVVFSDGTIRWDGEK